MEELVDEQSLHSYRNTKCHTVGSTESTRKKNPQFSLFCNTDAIQNCTNENVSFKNMGVTETPRILKKNHQLRSGNQRWRQNAA